jgi:hypothetical protein
MVVPRSLSGDAGDGVGHRIGDDRFDHCIEHGTARERAVCSLDGCGEQAAVLARYSGAIGNIALSEDRIFVTDTVAAPSGRRVGGVFSCEKSDCETTGRELSNDQSFPLGIVASETQVFWTNRAGGQIMKCSTLNCDEPPVVFADKLQAPLGIALDEQYVYFTDAAGGRVLRCGGRLWAGARSLGRGADGAARLRPQVWAIARGRHDEPRPSAQQRGDIATELAGTRGI